MRSSTTETPAPRRPRETLSDRRLKSKKLKPAPKGETYDVMDSIVPGFGIRVSETRRVTFILIARFPGSPHPTRRSLGIYGAIDLDQARNKARHWLELIRQGTDPRDVEERKRVAEQVRRANSFAAVTEDYIRFSVIGPNSERPKQRQGNKVAHELRTFFLPLWGDRPISEITRAQVQTAIKGIRDFGGHGMLAAHGVKTDPKRKRASKPAPGQARNMLGTLKTFFSWAVEAGDYGLESSPCRDLKAKTYVGQKMARHQVLSDVEVAALWRVTKRLRYPFGAVYRLLLLSGLRLNEVVGARWNEFDLAGRIWEVPASRMKGTAARARPHIVPLTDTMIELLEGLPRFAGGDHLFTLSHGAQPVWMTARIKADLDQRMLRTLRAHARMRGEDPSRIKLDWVNHDMRRTVRTGLSKLRVDRDTAEAVLAHAKVGIVGTYNVHDFLDEKREALMKWDRRLREITSPPSADNVVPLRA